LLFSKNKNFVIFNQSYYSVSKGLIGLSIILIFLNKFNLIILNQDIFLGGFLGINIIYFISGFAITQYFLKEWQEYKGISFGNFYKKIFFYSFLIIFFSIIAALILGYLNLVPIYFENLSKSVLSIFFLISNFYFHYSKLIMFWQNELLIPLEHFWAISLWLQFFILFPIFFVFILTFFKNYLNFFLILGIVLSLIFASWSFKAHTSFNYYTLPGHVWEFLLGSLLANNISNIKKDLKLDIIFVEILALFLLLILLICFISFDDSKIHPSYFTLIPIISVFGIIVLEDKSNIIKKILTNKIITFFGSISLSLYVWSHLLLSFIRIYNNNNITEVNIIYIIPILFFSIISYFVINKINLFIKKFSVYKYSSVLAIMVIFLIVLNINIILKNGFQNRLPDKLNIELIDDRFVNKELSIKCMRKFTNDSEFCEYNKNSTNEIFLIGDSIIDSINYNLKDKAELKNFKIVTMAKPGCYLWRLEARRCYDSYNIKREKRILQSNNSIIIIGGALWVYLDNNEIDKEKFLQSLKTFTDNGHKIILLYPLPIFNENVLEKISYDYFHGKRIINSIYIRKSDFINKTKKSFNFLNSLDNPNISKVKPHEIFCDKNSNKCIANKNDDIYFIDNSHPSVLGSNMINNLIVAEIKKISK
jgi:peptidoglycan/LPS O-acetylase OafA/YrhL